MSEEITEEVKPEVIQFSTMDRVSTLVKSYSLSGIATGYKNKIGKQPPLIYFDQGKSTVNDPTLSSYIKEAEGIVLGRYSSEVIKEAGEMINAELNGVRELLK